MLLGFSFPLGLSKWPPTFSPLNIWNIPMVHMWIKDFLALFVFPFSFPSRAFWIVVPTLHIHIYSYVYFCCEQCYPFEFPSLAVILKHNYHFINFISFLMADPSPPFMLTLMTWVFKRESLCNPNTNSFFLPKTLFLFSLSSPLPLPQTPPSIFFDQIPVQWCRRKAKAPPTIKEKRLSLLLPPHVT